MKDAGAEDQGHAPRKQEVPRPGMKARWVVRTIKRHGWKESFGQDPGGSGIPG